MSLKRQVNEELDKRAINKLVELGTISPEELSNASIITSSECCGVHFKQDKNNNIVCSKCGSTTNNTGRV